VGYEKVVVWSIKAVISLKQDKMEQKLLLTACIIKSYYVYEVLISAKVYDLE